MKASEYFERFKQEGSTLDSLSKVIKDMFEELHTLVAIRKVSTSEGFLSIYKEICQKWTAFAKRAVSFQSPEHGELKITPNLFDEVVKEGHPDLWLSIAADKARQEDRQRIIALRKEKGF